jgi:hypothetical protein
MFVPEIFKSILMFKEKKTVYSLNWRWDFYDLYFMTPKVFSQKLKTDHSQKYF